MSRTPKFIATWENLFTIKYVSMHSRHIAALWPVSRAPKYITIFSHFPTFMSGWWSHLFQNTKMEFKNCINKLLRWQHCYQHEHVTAIGDMWCPTLDILSATFIAMLKYLIIFAIFSSTFPLFQNEKKDLLFILTERYRVAILGYKPETADIVTLAYGDVQVFFILILNKQKANELCFHLPCLLVFNYIWFQVGMRFPTAIDTIREAG